MTDDDVLTWLLDADPSLRWQVERDLLHAPEGVWRATRRRVASEGSGARLLALQDDDGQWAGGAYFPREVREGTFPDEPGQPYTATTWSLNSLREWGVPPEALRPGTARLLAENSRWEYDDLPFWGGEVDACINAFTLANGAWLGADVSALAAWFPEHQLDDGGWNCEWVEGSVRSSFPSTVNVLEGLLEHEQRTGGSPALRAARHRGEEYLLARGLLRRLSTGEPHGPWVRHLSFPFRWTYSALRAASHLRAAALHDGTTPDPRMAEAVELIRGARDADGTWHQQARHEGRVWFEVDGGVGEPSRGLTLHALRLLAWWDGDGAAGGADAVSGSGAAAAPASSPGAR